MSLCSQNTTTALFLATSRAASLFHENEEKRITALLLSKHEQVEALTLSEVEKKIALSRSNDEKAVALRLARYEKEETAKNNSVSLSVSKGLFLSRLLHEIRTPIHIISAAITDDTLGLSYFDTSTVKQQTHRIARYINF